MKLKPLICDIYQGSKFYNIDKNIIRINIIFDDTDIKPRVYDVPLLSTGIFKNPDFRHHKVLVFIPDGVEKKIAIEDPEHTEIGESDIYIPIGILIDSQQYKKLMGSIGNAAFNIDSNVGEQNIENMDFFIPAGYAKTKLMDKPEIDEDEENMQVCGIGGSKDGSVFLRGPSGEVIIGPNGIRITGKLTIADGSSEKTDIFTENWLGMLPQTLVSPFPTRIPNVQKALSIAGIFTNIGNIASILRKA